MFSPVFIALGSNLGDRHALLNEAQQRLRQAGIEIEKVSTLRETDPVGGPGNQGPYLNGVLQTRVTSTPGELLHTLHEIEASLGRIRSEKDGPRTVDLDLLAFGDRVIAEPGLIVPHPRLQDRLFVLDPLAEIASAWVHPVFGRSASELRTRLQARLGQLASATPGRELAGLRVMVTGSTSGIGRAIALELARAGANVIVHGRQSLVQGQIVLDLCQQAGVNAALLFADCGHEADCVALADEAWKLWDGLDVWIHNAGADTLTGEGAKRSFEEKLETLWRVDVRGTMIATRRIGQKMKDRGQGAIVTLGWDQAETGMEGDSGQLFAASKGAIMAYTKSLSLSLAPQVRVNVIAPGWIRTAWGDQASPAWQARVRRETPLATWGLPEDIATTARWLISPAAKFITGQTLRVNGGAVR